MKRNLKDFGALTPAEMKVRDELHLGEPVIIGDGECPPEDAGPERQIRADFLRYLCLGACNALPGQVPEIGVWIEGARINGQLDLQGAEVKQNLHLFQCRLDAVLSLYDARLKNLYLNGSILPGLNGDRLQTEGSVYLRNTTVKGTVRLLGAKLGGDLDCDDASFEAEGNALDCDGLHAEGSVFLREAQVKGTILLNGAKLGAYLVCEGAELAAGKDGSALRTDGANVTGGFFLRPGKRPGKLTGLLDLSAAHFGHITDDPRSWPDARNLVLDRCTYGAFTGLGVSAPERIRWLKLQDPSRFRKDFWPQPWEQCAKVLREMGHVEDARKVLMEKERLQRVHRQRGYIERKRRPRAAWVALASDLLNSFVGYGHRPFRAIYWLGVFWLLGAIIYLNAAAVDAIKPNNPFVLRSAEWYACAPGYEPGAEHTAAPRNADREMSQLACFRAQPEAQSYPVFRAGIYSADTLLPIVHLEMQEFWIPDGDQSYGRWARTFLWVQIAMGWALSLLAVAGFSGLVKSD